MEGNPDFRVNTIVALWLNLLFSAIIGAKFES